MNSNKTFAITFEDGKWGKLRTPYDVNSGKGFDATKTFHPEWETSNLMDLFLKAPYGEISFKGGLNRDMVRLAAARLAQIGGHFVSHGFGAGFRPDGKEPHYVLYGDWMDDGTGSAIVVPKRFIAPDGKRIKTIEEMLGLKLHIYDASGRLKAR